MSDVAAQIRDAGVIAILRHLQPERAAAVGQALTEAGVVAIEVPLNDERSALDCISQLAHSTHDRVTIGAGTVTDPAQVRRVRDAGGRFVVSPDTNPEVIGATVALGMASCPGVMTPTEAFIALRSGADILKLFPASLHGPPGLSALLDVLPSGTPVIPVGGIGPDDLEQWRNAGASGIGAGGSLFHPSYDLDEISKRAQRLTQTWVAITRPTTDRS